MRNVLKKNKAGSRIFSIVLTAAITLTFSSCGFGQKKIDDNGKPITDFDEFVNREWYAAQAENSNPYYYYIDDERAAANDKYNEIILEDISAVSKDDNLYNAVFFFNELSDTSDLNHRYEKIKEYLEPIAEVETLDDLYKIYADEKYAVLNIILNFRVTSFENGYTGANFEPDDLNEIVTAFRYSLNDSTIEERESLLAYLENIGITEEKFSGLLDSAQKIGDMIDEYWEENVENDLDYFQYRQKYEEEGVSIPIHDIMESFGDHGKIGGFLAEKSCKEFLTRLYQPENTEALRDCMLLGAISRFMPVSAVSYLETQGVPDEETFNMALIYSFFPDVIAEEYLSRNVSDETIKCAEEMCEEIRTALSDTVYRSDIFTTHGKELARRKVMRMQAFIGRNGAECLYEDVNLTGDVVDDFLALLVSRNRFMYDQGKLEDEKRQIFKADVLDVNGKFFWELNEFIITAGAMGSEHSAADAPYEERLGYMGIYLAHEMSHAFDPGKINATWEGYADPWLTDEETEKYNLMLENLLSSFDGREIEFGRKMSGPDVQYEVLPDVLAVQLCLNILSQKENPDYDLFFRTYARKCAMYYTEEGIDEVLSSGYPPGKYRVNLVLGQFDEFYETYNIDKKSPFFIPKDKRIKLF